MPHFLSLKLNLAAHLCNLNYPNPLYIGDHMAGGVGSRRRLILNKFGQLVKNACEAMALLVAQGS